MLEIFDATTDVERRQKPPVLNINPDGRFSFSVEAVNVLGLEVGDKLAFAYDNADRHVVFFFRSESGIELQKSETATKKSRLVFCSRSLSRKLLGFMGVGGVKSFAIKRETTKLENGKEAWFILKYSN